MSLAGLTTLYAAWCQNVPFDNVRKRIHLHRHDRGALPGDDPVDFLEAWLAHGTGGTCWAGNGALHAVLETLGFRASRGVATMMVAPDAAPNHGTVLVRFAQDRRYLVDASMLHGAPLPLEDRRPTGIDHPAWGVHCRTDSGHWIIRWHPFHLPAGLDCRVESLEASAKEFRERHERTRTSSRFNDELFVRHNRGQGVVGVTKGIGFVLTPSGALEQRALRAQDQKTFLVEQVGLDPAIVDRLPPDVEPAATPG